MYLPFIRVILVVYVISGSAGSGTSQDTTRTNIIAARVTLDSVVIVATRQGFSIDDFIRLVQTDESLYSAFRNLRSAAYHFDTQMAFHDRRNNTKATWYSRNRQTVDGACRTTVILSEEWTGDFYKGRKQKHRYYTYDLYERVFATPGTICSGSAEPSETASGSTSTALERQVGELKKLIFRPGERSNVPLIGRKSEIFSHDMIDYYDFAISSGVHHDKPVYIFTATVKDIYASKENKTVFKELTTAFHKTDFQVVARTYRLSQKTAAYQFDVSMAVDLIRQGDNYYPQTVHYEGEWNIPTKKRESGMFIIEFNFNQ